MKKALILSMILLTAVIVSCDLAGLTKNLVNKNESGIDDKFGDITAKKPNSIIVTFDALGGTVTPEYKVVKHGPDYGVLPEPLWLGHVFEGWWTEAGGNGVQITAESKVKVKDDHILYAKWKTIIPNIIKGTAAIGTTSISFVFSIPIQAAVARSLSILPTNGYINDEVKSYALTSILFDSSTGEMAGSTEAIDGVSYAFEGNYSTSNGLVGEITKTDSNITQSGAIAGMATYPESDVANYYGVGLFNETGENLPETTWNVTLNFSSNQAVGTWCERSLPNGIPSIAYGTISGTIIGKTLSGKAYALPQYVEQMYHLNIDWEGTISPDKETISGIWCNHYDLGYSDGTFVGTNISN